MGAAEWRLSRLSFGSRPPALTAAGHYLNPDFYLRIYVLLADGDLVLRLAVGCRALLLHITLTIKADIVFAVIDYRNSSKFEAGARCLIASHLCTRTHADPSPSLLSKLVNQISAVPTCLDLNHQTQAVDFSG